MARQTVLIVDDHHDTRAIVSDYLRHHGYDVLVAADGEEGVRVARERLPDIVVMDLKTPRLDGFAAARRLKREPATAEIPIILMTASYLEETRRLARSVGCDDFLAKPCMPPRLLRAIRRLLPPPEDRS